MSNIEKLNLPNEFVTKISNTFGNEGNQWLSSLPELISTCEQTLNLKIGDQLRHLSYNYVAAATREEGAEIVIKFGAPTPDFTREIKALEFMQGDGIVELLHFEEDKRVALLEKLMPGAMLKTVNDDEQATAIAAKVMQKLWRPINPEEHNFPTTQQWFNRLNKPIDTPIDFPDKLIESAAKVAEELHQQMDSSVLLHGDLHHENILSATRQQWIAIDPKGVIGEPAYEVGALLRNPIPEIVSTMNTKKILTQRIDQLTDMLNFDRKKVINWAFSQAVLAAVWCIDDKSDDYKLFIKCAKILSEIKQ